MQSRRENKRSIFDDEALRKGASIDLDEFKLFERLRPIYAAVLDKETVTPFSVLITGTWGTGKTSAMQWLDDFLRASSQDISTCWFHPWKYQSQDDVWKGLIAEVIVTSIGLEDVDASKVIKAAKQFGKFLGGSFISLLSSIGLSASSGIEATGKAGVDLDIGKALEGVFEEYQKHITPQQAYYNVFERTLETWIRDCYKGNKRLVVFIDDLDRCLPDIALRVLEAVKLYLKIPNLIVVVGVDRQIIDAVVINYYEKHVGMDDQVKAKARQYLDKLFQVEIPISPGDKMISEFVDRRASESLLWEKMSVDHGKHLRAAIKQIADINPRSVIRALNNAIIGVGSESNENSIAQSVQSALVHAVVSRLSEEKYGAVLDLCLREEGRAFLRDWSRALGGEEGRAQYLVQNDLERQSDVVKDQESSNLQKKREEFHDLISTITPSGLRGGTEDKDQERIDSLLDVAKNHPRYQLLMTLPVIGKLMLIPFPEEQVYDRTEWAPLIEVYAESQRIGPDQVTADDLLRLRKLHLTSQTLPVTVFPLIGQLVDLEYLDLDDTQSTDSGLKYIEGLKRLRSVDLAGTKVTDTGLKYLTGLGQLEWLGLDRTEVTSEGMKFLEGMHALKQLHLSGTRIGDDGLLFIRNLKEVNALDLSNTQITDLGLTSLAEFNKLEWLNISRTPTVNNSLEHKVARTSQRVLSLSSAEVTGQGLKHLRRLASLKKLDVGSIEITDSDLEHLQSMSGLVILALNHTCITDKGLKYLKRLDNLKWLSLEGTQVTENGRAWIKRNLPKCEVV